jgi:hypothetical protein
MSRKSLSKRLRFEIFKRDGFRCVYCGTTPTQSVLHVDHVVPVAEGGTDDPSNLATSCADCNGGKSAVPLERKTLAPARTAEEVADHAEQIRAYLEEQRRLEDTYKDVAETVASYWEERIGGMTQFMFDRMVRLVREWPIEKLHEAIEITGRRLGTPGKEYRPRDAVSQAKYFQGILRRWREEGR